ncbi:MAG: hypothetical protein WDZ31_09135 [Phycisphaeraceae bacterium]
MAMLVVRRQYAIWPIIIMLCFLPSAQRVVVGGLDFTLLRVLILFGWARLLMRGETSGLVWHRLDTIFVIWLVPQSLFPVLDTGGLLLVNRAGLIYDAAGLYFLFRCLIRDWEDLRRCVYCLAYCSIPSAAIFLIEWTTGRNMFAVFGGVPEITHMRDGRLRCQGPFAHAILAGVFWASVLPMIASLLWEKRPKRVLIYASIVSVLVIVVTCSSATPVMAVAFGALGCGMWLVRRWMTPIRWSVAIGLVALHFVMQAPVWHLITRIDVVGGESYHRYRLIQAAIDHAHEWWFIGSRAGTGHWGHMLYDVTNYYIVQGLHGGVLQVALLAILFTIAFGSVGRVVRSVHPDRTRQIYMWAVGVSLFTHAMSFIAVSYFGQLMTMFYLDLAIIGSLGVLCASRRRRRSPRAVVVPQASPVASPVSAS